MNRLYYRQLYYFLICVGLWLPAQAQRNKSTRPVLTCTVPELTPEQRKALESEAAFALQLKRAKGNKATGITYIPIRPHILRNSTGTGGLPLDRLNNILARANRYYLVNGNGIQFYFCGTTPDYIDNGTLFSNYAIANESTLTSGRDVNNALNMYFVNTTNEGFSGYAYYPSNTVQSTRAIIVGSLTDAQLGDRTVPHELGHNFNLVHTHGTGNSSNELVTRGAGANCTTEGDFLCDTPADPYGRPGHSTTFGPDGCLIYTGTATDANGATYTPPMNNLMSYYDPCRYEFTAGQYARMDAGLALRQSHTAYTLTCAPTVVNAPTNLLASNIPTGVVLTWTDNGTNEMGYFIERATSAAGPFMSIGGVGPNTTTYTDPNPPSNTLVYYRVRPSNSTTGGISTAASIQTLACRPTFSVGCVEDDGLNRLVVNSVQLSQNTGCASGATGYSQYTTVTTSLTPGTAFAVSGTLISSSFPEGVSIWLDLNRNGVFDDAGERLFATPSLVFGSFSGNLTIPASVTAGPMAMRVIVAYNATPADPCGSYEYGEAEDYQINIVVPSGCDPLEPNDTYQTATPLADGANYVSPPICLNSGTDGDWFRWRTVGGGQTYYIRVRPATNTTSGPYALSVTVSGSLLTVTTGPTTGGQSTDTYLELYAADGTTLLVQNDDYTGAFSQLVYAFSGPQPCQPPQYRFLNTISNTSAEVGWTAVSGAQYQIRHRPVGSSTWVTSAPVSASAYSITGLTTGTTYEWQIQTVCSATSVSGYMASLTFVTGCYAPVSQGVTYRTSTSALLFWENKGNGLQYELNYRAVGAANWTSVSSLTAPAYLLTGLTNTTAYEFGVRTLCGAAGTSGYSTPTSFTTLCAEPQNLQGFGNAQSGTQAVVSWMGVLDGQTRYEVRYRPVGAATYITWPAPVTATALSLSGLVPNTTYEFGVRTLCSDGQNSTFTAPATFTTTACQMPFSLFADLLNLQGARLNWSTLEPGMTYFVRYRETGSINWLTPTPASTSATSYSLGGLMPGVTYEWQVYTGCAGAVSSSIATGSPFTTLSCPAPANLVLGNLGSTSVTLGWTVSQPGVPVQVQWRVAGTTVWSSATTAAGATNYLLTGLSGQTTYEWRIQTLCSAVYGSVWVSGASFTTTDPVCRPTYLNGCGAGDALVSLALNGEVLSLNTGCSPGGFAFYNSPNTFVPAGASVPISGTFAASYGEGVTVFADLNRDGVFGTSEKLYQTEFTVMDQFNGIITVPSGTANGPLRIRVMVVYGIANPNDPCGSYDEGETEDYVITVGVPATYSPRTQNITRNEALLRWNLLTQGLSYEVQWRPVGGSTWTTVPAGTATTLSLTGLAAGTAYEWQMRPVGTASWNGPVSFTTVGCNPPVTYSAGSITPNSAVVNWQAGSVNPSGTLFDVRFRAVAEATWSTVSGVMTTSQSLTGLNPSTAYVWEVRSVCTPGESSTYTPGPTFTTLACPLPTALNANAGLTTAALSWQGPSTTLYEVQWQEQANPTSWNSLTVTTRSASLTGLVVNRAYNWRVRTLCTAFESSAFTAPASFTTRCAVPTGLSTDGINAYAARLNWTAVGSNAVYTISMRPSGGTWTTAATDWPASPYILTNLTNATGYEWRVEATCVASSLTVSSGVSNPQAFTSVCPTPSSANIYVSGLSSATALANWLGQPNGAYQAQWRPIGATNWVSSPIVNEATLAGQNYTTPLTSLSAGTGYELRVRMECPNGVSSGYSSAITFTTSPTVACSAVAPSLLYSVPGATQATLHWGSSASPQAEVRWRAVGETVWLVASRLPGGGSVSFVAQNLLPNTAYEWQAGGMCAGQEAVFSSVQTFTTSSCVIPTNLAAACVQATGAVLNWNGPAGATYELRYRIGAGNPVSVTGLTTNSYALTGLVAGNSVGWEVRSVCSASVSSSFSAPASVSTVCVAPAVLSVVQLMAADSCGYARINWAGCTAGLAQYDLQYRQQGAGTWTSVGSLGSTRFTLGGLLPGTAYEYRINTACGGGNSSAYTVGSFTTIACACVPMTNTNGLSAIDITASAATVQWYANTPSNTYRVRWRAAGATVWSTSVVTGTALRLTDLTDNTTYDWQIQYLCASGQYADYSPISYFRTLCNAPLSLLATTVLANSAELSWNGFGSGVTYSVQYRLQGVGSWTTLSGISSETYSLTGLQVGGTYEAQVATQCVSGSITTYGPPITFQTICAGPTFLRVGDLTANSALLQWRGSIDETYEVQWRAVGNTAWNTVSVGPLSSTVGSFTLIALDGGTAYEWRVLNRCGAGFSEWAGQPLTFKTLAGGPGCTGPLTTVKNGDWNDPTVWSCGRVPTSADAVLVNHAVTVSAGATGYAARLTYGAAARLTFGVGSRLRLGQ
ncbi:hypothetical protein F5984_09210 [Rudanella paleaurantiibacter]|uniref:Fibronectin type-III domain-containing protein n=1 Tax=Rudanella paleaurantiibacter TaxID=2614655 RepID=A0A7J5TZS8_9BACT|nr:fibronectin type III domain-containing protein [Rudanella paleaurantiibacter]KAB7730998.1 hypothetical protein F5984_09210 [Rudanella paleaurantiibacter]